MSVYRLGDKLDRSPIQFQVKTLAIFDQIQSAPSDVPGAEDKYQELVKEAQDRNVSWQSYMFRVMKSWYGNDFQITKRVTQSHDTFIIIYLGRPRKR